MTTTSNTLPMYHKNNNNHVSHIRVTSFAVALPTELLGPRALDEVSGIVGTITWLGDKSVMVWFGLGQVHSRNSDDISQEENQIKEQMTIQQQSNRIGSALQRPMGPFMVAMPRSRYQGAFGTQTPISKLVGHEQEDIELLTEKMASRLSQRIQKAVFVSCDLDPMKMMMMISTTTQGNVNHKLQQTVAALAEREVYRILEDDKKNNNNYAEATTNMKETRNA